MSITWWSASVVVRCDRRVRQTLFHTVGGTGPLRRDKERGVLGVGVLSRDHVRAPVPEGSSVDAQAFLCSSFVRSCNHRFSSVSCTCTKLLWSLELPSVDATTFARCLTCHARDAHHVDPAGVSVLSNTASLHSTAIVEFVAARMRACSS